MNIYLFITVNVYGNAQYTIYPYVSFGPVLFRILHGQFILYSAKQGYYSVKRLHIIALDAKHMVDEVRQL